MPFEAREDILPNIDRNATDGSSYQVLCANMGEGGDTMLGVIPKTEHSHYGEVKYDVNGKPICHICGRSFNALLGHVRRVHKIGPIEYKITYGLNVTKGILSKRTYELLRDAALEHIEIVQQNLACGVRYQEGHDGRTRDKLSEQGRQRLIQFNKQRRSN